MSIQLPETGFVRLPQIIGNPKAIPPIPAIVPVCRSTWWAGVASGRYPNRSLTTQRHYSQFKLLKVRLLR